MKTQHLLAPLLAWATLTSCAQTPPASPPPAPTPVASAPEPESARLAREVSALIGPAACTSTAQCRTVPIGAKACGGPAGYLAWSTQGTDAATLTALATRQSEAQKRENESSGMRSNCAMVMDPGAACVANRCQLSTAQGGKT